MLAAMTWRSAAPLGRVGSEASLPAGFLCRLDPFAVGCSCCTALMTQAGPFQRSVSSKRQYLTLCLNPRIAHKNIFFVQRKWRLPSVPCSWWKVRRSCLFSKRWRKPNARWMQGCWPEKMNSVAPLFLGLLMLHREGFVCSPKSQHYPGRQVFGKVCVALCRYFPPVCARRPLLSDTGAWK